MKKFFSPLALALPFALTFAFASSLSIPSAKADDPVVTVDGSAVVEKDVPADNGLVVPTYFFYPKEAPAKALGVVVMLHGDLMNQHDYRDILRHVAASGFVVMAPQLYHPDVIPFGKPSPEEDARNAAHAFAWFASNVPMVLDHPVDVSKVGLLGHSMGGKIAWVMVRDQLLKADAVAALDPVDGDEKGSPMATTSDTKMPAPALIVGTGLGGKALDHVMPACAPTGRNYQSFWNNVGASGSWLHVAQDYGHMDMVDDVNKCGVKCAVCVSAPKDTHAAFRAWAGHRVALFMRAHVLGDGKAKAALTTDVPTINVTTESR